MMNNCQKCGNPLQPGQTMCPICGTSINETEKQETPVLNTNPLNIQQSPVVTAGETLTEVSPQPIAPSLQQPNNQIGEYPSRPTEGVIAPSIMTENTNTPIQGGLSIQNPLDTLAPTVNVVPESTPIPSIAAGTPIPNIPAQTTVSNTMMQPVEQKRKKGKFSKNQKVIVVGALVIMLIVIVGAMMSSKSMVKTPNNTNNTPNQSGSDTTKDNPQEKTEIALKEAVTNGYKLKYEEGWVIEEDSYNVLMKKSDESIVIKLEHFSYNLADFDQTVIESYLAQREGITNSTVEKTTIGGKEAYLMTYNVITQTNTSYPVESYFINGGTNLIIGATIIYQSEMIKQANSNSIFSLMENVSYEDESVKALDSINMYYNAFSLYADIIGNSKKEEPVINEEMGEENQIQEENGNGEEQNGGVVDNNTPEDSQNTSQIETPETN